MITYLLRRILYAIPILIGVNVITFTLFFLVNSPDDVARMHLGEKYVTQNDIATWKHEHDYDLPLFFNADENGWRKIEETLFYRKSIDLFRFKFGTSLQGRDIGADIFTRMWPSLAIALPTFIIGLAINITFALIVTLFRATMLDTLVVILCVIMMSISGLFYIILGQYVFGKVLQWFPISGYQGGWQSIKFVILPVAVGIISSVGAGTRWYRTIFLEEMHKDYVRTARAKGLSEMHVLYKHVLKNALLPILTGVVVIIPSLFLGSLIIESFFGIPGLGSYTLEAINTQDFDIVRVMVFLGTLLYIIGLILTDISYTLVDPRVRLGSRTG